MSSFYIVTEGDSLTSGNAGQTPYPVQLALLYTKNNMVAVSNMATSGARIANLVSEAAAQITAQYDARKGTNILVVWIGTNDLNDGTSPATIYTNVSGYCGCELDRYRAGAGGFPGNA